MDRGDISQGGEGFGFGGTVNGSGMSELGYTWNDNSTWSFNSGLYPPANQWSLVAVVIQPTGATIYLMNTNGLQTAVNAIAHDSEPIGVAWRVGDDEAGDTGGGVGARTFPGEIADACVFLSALSSSQVAAIYNAGLRPRRSPCPSPRLSTAT